MQAPTSPIDGSAAPARSAADAPTQRVRRTHILSRVFATDAPRVVLLQAPAGHGKSTALQQIREVCEANGLRTAWLHLDESDNDRRRHANRLRAALEPLALAPSTPVSNPATPTARRLPQRADWLIDELAQAESGIALFLDEFEVLVDRSVLAFWKDFFLRGPANVRVFMASRSMPEVGMARLLVAHRALLLSAEELRFSEQEVRQFFAQGEVIGLQRGEIETIYRRTEGWPAALQLFRLGLARDSSRSALGDLHKYRPRELSEYVADRVLDLQPDDIRDFLMKTSVLPRLTAPLCDLLTGRSDSGALLIALERAGMFVRAIDHELQWFRYHALFASQLRDQLRSSYPDGEKAIYRQAAQWLFEHEHLDDAMQCAAASGDVDFAARVLESWSSSLVTGGELATITRWLELIPPQQITRRPRLAINAAWALVFMSRRTQAAPVIAALAPDAGLVLQTERQNADTILAIAHVCADEMDSGIAVIRRFRMPDAPAGSFNAFCLAAAENVTAYHFMTLGQLDEARASLLRARSYNRPAAAVFSGGYTTCVEGVAKLLQGQLGAALDVLHPSLVNQRQALDANFASAPLASCCVWALYEAGELPAAKAIYTEYHDMILECSIPDLFVVGPVCMSRIHRLAGSDADAEDVLAQAEFIANANGWPRIVDILNWERLRARIVAGGALDAAAEALYGRLLQAHPRLPDNCVPVSDMLEGPAFGMLRIALLQGDLDTAHGLISAQREQRPGYDYRQLRLYLFNAQLLLRRGMRPAALRRLRQALDLAVSGGFVRPLLDEGRELLPLLRELARGADFAAGSPSALFLERLLELAGCGGDAPSLADIEDARARLDLLTPREQQLLGYLGQRLTNREMAQRASLSENTVKFHLKNIFEKLGVSTRLQAYRLLDRSGQRADS